ncbi:hypothetical protein L218DRAFT_962966 [Marasmius fiardii PR-910]|nr:hypothetical protein L218DRAFT_962966 [Marasmius fiardii PR-910]
MTSTAQKQPQQSVSRFETNFEVHVSAIPALIGGMAVLGLYATAFERNPQGF